MKTNVWSKAHWRQWQSIAKRAMMLGLILCCAGCASTSSRLATPSIGDGNAILTTLPVGTILILPTGAQTQQIRQLFLNETRENEGGGLRICAPLKLATPEYILERDAHEGAALQELLKQR